MCVCIIQAVYDQCNFNGLLLTTSPIKLFVILSEAWQSAHGALHTTEREKETLDAQKYEYFRAVVPQLMGH